MKWLRYHFDTVDSTNQIAQNYPPYTAITADIQTNGRGRYGRVWQSAGGNLCLSLVLPDFREKNPFLAFVTGVAVARALAMFRVQLKWPNDVLLNGAKVAGILLELVDQKMIVGIGVNVVNHPMGEMNYPVADLGGRISKEQLTERILTEMDNCLNELEQKGFACICEQWRALSYLKVGESMAVRLPNRMDRGKFNGIDENGLLLLDSPEHGIIQISAGDVFKIE